MRKLLATVALAGLAASAGGVQAQGLFSSLYVDRGSHYWYTEAAGGRVDKTRLTQVHRALRQLGITRIPAYSPEARGRSERVFRTLQDRLPKELALAGITKLAAANQYLTEQFLPAYNRRFAVAAAEPGTAFVPWIGTGCQDRSWLSTNHRSEMSTFHR